MSQIITLKDNVTEPDFTLSSQFQQELEGFTQNKDEDEQNPPVMKPFYVCQNSLTVDDQNDDNPLPLGDHGVFARFEFRRDGLDITAVPIWKGNQPHSQWSELPNGFTMASEYYPIDKTSFFARPTDDTGSCYQPKLATDVCLLNFSKAYSGIVESDVILPDYCSGKLSGLWVENLLQDGNGHTILDRLARSALSDYVRPEEPLKSEDEDSA